VIATYHAGIPEIVLNDKTGLLVPERSVLGLEKSIEFFIEHPEAISQMGSNGRRMVESNFNIKELNLRLDRLLHILSDLGEKENVGIKNTREIAL
jgi:colanic acid/amylovoran biosynthesis glycosyltransferase